MRKDLGGIYQTLSKVRNINQDTKGKLEQMRTIQDEVFTDDPMGGYVLPTPVETKEIESPEIKGVGGKKENKKETPQFEIDPEQKEKINLGDAKQVGDPAGGAKLNVNPSTSVFSSGLGGLNQ